MVEKWLIQVEDNMISSIRRKISEAIDGYKETPRGRWVIDWPGQVVLCVSSIFWTSEVSEAMKIDGGVQVMCVCMCVCVHLCASAHPSLYAIFDRNTIIL